MQTIKWYVDSSWAQSVVLGNDAFHIEVMWNARDNSWYMTMKNSNNETLFEQKKLVLGQNLFDGIKDNLKPSGALLVVPITSVKEITRDNIGDSVEIVYLSENEIA
jgi:hypothetical protein